VTGSRRGNGEGSAITQRKDGRYVAAIRYEDAQGKARRAYVYGRTKAQVREKLREARRRVRGRAASGRLDCDCRRVRQAVGGDITCGE
jgi:hypothetical protein